MFQFKRGCKVPYPKKILEQFEVGAQRIHANVSAEKVDAMLRDFIEQHDEPLFLVLEVPTNANDEPKNEKGETECFHKDVYYLDKCTREDAYKLLDAYGELMIHDGLNTFGFGGHFSHEEILFGKYNVMTVFSKDAEKYIGFFEKYGVKQTDALQTAWDTFTKRKSGKSSSITISDKDIYAIPEELKAKGMYFAERRED